MLQGQKTIFKDNKKLVQMLNLRRCGYSTTFLAAIYGCDHTSILFQCNKFNVEPMNDVYSLEQILRQILPTFKYQGGERINVGKSYAEYLKEAKRV